MTRDDLEQRVGRLTDSEWDKVMQLRLELEQLGTPSLTPQEKAQSLDANLRSYARTLISVRTQGD